MDLIEILNKKVSFQQNAWSPIEDEVFIKDIIKYIKRGKYEKEVN